MTPRSKHYAIKYHWFREQIGPRGITLVKIETKEQLRDIFTKGLGRITFEYLRKKLMGWYPRSFFSEGGVVVGIFQPFF